MKGDCPSHIYVPPCGCALHTALQTLVSLLTCMISLVCPGDMLICKIFFYASYFLQIIDDCDTRMGDTVEELVEMVVQVLPPPTIQMESIEVIGQDKEENPEERQMDAS
ncbi:unnamed protein product [Ilex paraguariensis]|uniref:Uncharacterized protein n=1 Tax=Ilex paraguariensis TaxID=185542 RepID=A0ABC8TUD0_9AQUA